MISRTVLFSKKEATTRDLFSCRATQLMNFGIYCGVYMLCKLDLPPNTAFSIFTSNAFSDLKK